MDPLTFEILGPGGRRVIENTPGERARWASLGATHLDGSDLRGSLSPVEPAEPEEVQPEEPEEITEE